MCGYASSAFCRLQSHACAVPFRAVFFCLFVFSSRSEFCNGIALVGHCGHVLMHMHNRPLSTLVAVLHSPFNGVHGTCLPEMSPRHAIFAVPEKRKAKIKGDEKRRYTGWDRQRMIGDGALVACGEEKQKWLRNWRPRPGLARPGPVMVGETAPKGRRPRRLSNPPSLTR